MNTNLRGVGGELATRNVQKSKTSRPRTGREACLEEEAGAASSALRPDVNLEYMHLYLTAYDWVGPWDKNGSELIDKFSEVIENF